MQIRHATRAVLLLSAIALPGVTWAADPPDGAAKPQGAAKAPAIPRLYVATGPSSEADLASLRAALSELAGVQKVEARAEFGAVTVTIDGDGRSTQSLFAAAARSVGFVLRPAPDRTYAAAGPSGEADLTRLRAALTQLRGVERVDMGVQPDGAAVRISGVTGYDALRAAGKSAGFTLRQIGSYVASGPSAPPDLARLRAALAPLPEVEQVEMQGLNGGATLLIYGDVRETRLVQGAKSAGFLLWPLGSAARSTVSLPSLVPEADRNTPPDYDERVLEDQAKPGGQAPEFSLLALNGTKLSLAGSLAAGKPIVLVFGSCT